LTILGHQMQGCQEIRETKLTGTATRMPAVKVIDLLPTVRDPSSIISNPDLDLESGTILDTHMSSEKPFLTLISPYV